MKSIKDFVEAKFNEVKKDGFQILQHPGDFVPFMDFALDYLKDRKEIRFLEVGILFGASFKIIGECFQYAGHKVFGVAVDLPKADARFGGVEVPDIPASLIKIKPGFDYEFIEGNSQDTKIIEKVKTFAPFDLAFIDGDHTIKGHMADRNNYMPMTNGLMAFHDLGEDKHEVKKNWPNIREGHKFWEFVFEPHYGIGVIEVKK